MKPYIQYRSNGRIWQAGRTILGLCAAYNHATNPVAMMSDSEHSRSFAYARAIKARMARLGYRHGSNYLELSNGTLWPVKA
jgi:hypothetical protein